MIQAEAKSLKSVKYYGEECLKILFSSLIFQLWFYFQESINFGSILIIWINNRQSWKFSKVKFWPKTKIKNIANTEPLNFQLLLELNRFIFTSWLEKGFEVTENIQKINCEENRAKLQ